ncbi:hypothetical protein Btru_063535 [Bulinus truncatus]|nr:hypothetical protein Btru_063535 [Bulinus truncatus]
MRLVKLWFLISTTNISSNIHHQHPPQHPPPASTTNITTNIHHNIHHQHPVPNFIAYWGPLCSAEPLDLSKKNERELLVDLQHRCNGIDACVMDDFFMPEVAIKCNNNPQITKNIDAEFTCKPHASRAKNVTCDFKDRESDSSTGNGQVLTINEIILLTVIPVSFVVAITVTCLALYRCGIICKSNRKNTNDILTKNGSIQDDINYNSTITVSDIQGQRTSQTVDVYSDIDAKSPVKNTNYHQLDKSVKRSDEFKETADTYAVVRKVQRTPNSNVEFQISISSVPHGNTSNEVSNDYAHFGQVQGRTFQTENVYGAVLKVRHAIFDDF